MIERYSTKEMKAIWNDENKYKTWLWIELAVLKVCARGLLPKEDYLAVRKGKSRFRENQGVGNRDAA